MNPLPIAYARSAGAAGAVSPTAQDAPAGAAAAAEQPPERQALGLLPGMANRHGLITGATGTGKTVTLQVMAEQFSSIGVPVFLADVKGDLSGLGRAGAGSPKLDERLARLGLPAPQFRAAPVAFWDVFGERGHPLRATVSDMGPLLLARMLGLNDTQEGVLQMAFKIADDSGLLLLDSKDLRAMLSFVGDNAAQLRSDYGNISPASVGAIQRRLMALEEQGADRFFGEPMLKLEDLMQTDLNGHGVVNILAADKLLNSPRLYATFLLWLMSELFEQMPEVGDAAKPRFVLFFDEAHLLFNEAPRALMEKVEQVVRLIRSKGVGIYFVTQNPQDVPNSVLGQLGNRVQHALRAFTPIDRKAVRAAAQTMRANPAFDAEEAITELGVGEALVSFLDAKGQPTVVERAFVRAPGSRIGPMTDEERAEAIRKSLVAGIYDQPVDRESAYEKLRARAAQIEAEQAKAKAAEQAAGDGGVIGGPVGDILGGLLGAATGGAAGGTARRASSRQSVVEAAAKSAARSIGSSLGRAVIRGVMGTLFGSRSR